MAIALVPYDDVKRKRTGEVHYHPTALNAVPKLKLRKSFGVNEPDTEVLGRAIWTELETLGAGTIERLACYYTAQPRKRLRIFVYIAGRRVTTLEAAVIGNLDIWLSGAATKMHRGDHGLILLVETNGAAVSALMEADERDIETAPIKLFKKWAPPKFNRADEAKRKAAYLAKLDGKKGAVAADDPRKVEELLLALVSRRKHEVAKLGGDVDAQVAALEKEAGVMLPEAVKAVWRTIDGAKDLFFGHHLLSLKQALDEWRSWRDIYDEWTLEDLQGNVEAQSGVTQKLYCCPKWVPIIDLVGGNYLAIDLIPGPQGNLGQLIVAGRDIETVRRIAPDMQTFLELCAEHADGGRNVLRSVFEELAL